MTSLTSGCVVLPDVADVNPAPAVVSILDKKVDPPAIVPTVLGRSEPLASFDVVVAVSSQNLKGPVFYSWYYDYEDNNSIRLPYYSLCGDSPRCLFSVCSKPKRTEPDHRLLLVVSDSKLNANAKGPIDFPPGAAFDTVQWQLTLEGICPP